jgi:transposase
MNNIQLKPYTVLELAKLYGVSDRTMKKWIKPFEKEIGKKIGYFYTIAQVKIIFEKLGMPGEFIED